MDLTYYWIGVCVLLAFKLWWDIRAKNNGRVISHARSTIIDTAFYCVGIWFVTNKWNDMAGLLLLSYWFRWTFFDLLWNKFTGNHWAYCGNSSVLDIWFDKIDGKDDEKCVMAFGLKFILLALGLSLIVFL